jgi:hypothetical protein
VPHRLIDKQAEAVELIDRGLGWEDITKRLNLYHAYRQQLLQMIIGRQAIGRIKGKDQQR